MSYLILHIFQLVIHLVFVILLKANHYQKIDPFYHSGNMTVIYIFSENWNTFSDHVCRNWGDIDKDAQQGKGNMIKKGLVNNAVSFTFS